MSSDTDRRRELEESVAEMSGFIAAHDEDLDDPILGDRLAMAHYKRARALKQLERHRESLADWDRFLRAWAALHPHPTGSVRARLVVALAMKSESLWLVGCQEESTLLEEEIAERFGDDEAPAIRWFVTMALIRLAQKQLARDEETDAALVLSDQLIRRLRGVPDDHLAGATRLMLTHARHLIALRGTSLTDYVTSLGELALNGGIAGTEAVVHAIQARFGALWLDAVTLMVDQLTPEAVRRHRRRQEQALKVLDALTDRLTDAEDPELGPLAVQVRFLRAAVTGAGGRVLDAVREMEEVWSGRDHSTVQALSQMAQHEAGKPGWMSQLNAVTFLSRRATSLVGEDPALARLAYDDSISAQLGERLSPAIRLAVRLMRPGGRREEN